MATIDCVTYNGEDDLLGLRFSILNPVVDKFVIIEFDTTFSGKPKKRRFNLKKYKKLKKIEYHFITGKDYMKYFPLAAKSPTTAGANHWKREFAQKESIKKILLNLHDDDIIYIGDVDEIWDPANTVPTDTVQKLKLRVFTYYLDLESSEVFWGTIKARYKDIKGKCLNHLRSLDHQKTEDYAGWHFTSMGGYDKVKQKLSDSYTRESYWTEAVENSLEQNLKNHKDFLGRDFSYIKDETNWPEYLKKNKSEYQHLCLNIT